MTVRNPLVRRISGIALLALFLTFVSVQVYPGTKDEAGESPYDESRVTVASGLDVALVLRNNPKNAANGGFIDKVSGSYLSTSPSALSLVGTNFRTATKKAIPQILSNPFYVVLTAKAP